MKIRPEWSSLFFLVLGLLFGIGSLRYPVWDQYGPGPGFFPLLLGVFLGLLSLSFFLGKIIRGRDSGSESFRFPNLRKVMPYLGALLCFYLLFNLLGFLLTIFFFMSGVLILIGKRSVKLSLSIAVVSSLFVYLIFIKLMSVSLPVGILGAIIEFY
jgi:putative tricarboxylic transport membrane protein